MVVNHLVLFIALTAIGASALPKQEKNQETNSATDDLWKAVAAGDVAGTRRAVANGADLSSTRKIVDNIKGTALHLAARLGYADVAMALISEGANIHAKDDRSRYIWTPLYWAVSEGRVDVARVLLAAGADVEERDATLWTPIFAAAQNDRPNAALMLIEAGVDVNARQDTRKTALHHAAEFDRLYTARILVENGADVNARDEDGRTPLGFANGNSDTAAYLRSVGGK